MVIYLLLHKLVLSLRRMGDTQTVPTWQLHHRLALALEHSGISAEQMAEELGMHVNSVHNYAAGRRAPKLSTLKVWADACGVPREWLIGGGGADTSSESLGQPYAEASNQPRLFDARPIRSFDNRLLPVAQDLLAA